MRITLFALSLCLLALGRAAIATECDQFTLRDLYGDSLPDSLERANNRTNSFLDEAVAAYNRRFKEAPRKPEGLERDRYLALAIHNAIAQENRFFLPREEEALPLGFNPFRALGKLGRGPLQAWIENPHIQGDYLFVVANNAYRGVYPPGFDVTLVVKIAGVLTGTDKLDHFFDQGYEYWRVSDYGASDSAAIAYGVDSEWGWYGIKTSGVFSFGDLRANWEGYLFYKGLSRYFRFDEAGLLSRIEDFDWKDWIDWQFDELLNPSYYTASLFARVRATLRDLERGYEEGRGDISPLRTWQALAEREIFGSSRPRRSSEYLNDSIPKDFPLLFDLADLLLTRQSNAVQTLAISACNDRLKSQAVAGYAIAGSVSLPEPHEAVAEGGAGGETLGAEHPSRP